mgnify:CR=1 FL=1
MIRPTFKFSDILGLTPAPIQKQLLSCNEFEVGMITGFASGKTRALCAAAISHAVKNPGARILLGRKTYAEMVNTVKNPFFQMADPLHRAGWFVRPQRWDYLEGTHLARLINGSEIIFSNLDDPVKFRNEEYSMVLVDQAEETDETLWETLTGRVRWAKVAPEAWQVVAAANDNGHNWIWRRFVWKPEQHAKNPKRCSKNPYCTFDEGHPDEEGVPRLGLPCSTRRFFHGTTLDNKHNLSPRYLATLLAHPVEWQRHFIYATMEGGAGRLLPDPVVLPHFEPPAHWPKYRAIDHALNSPCCCVWIAVNSDNVEHRGVPVNASYIYREYWQDNASVDQHVQRIRALSAGERFVCSVIDRSTYSKTQSRPQGIRVSLADLYIEEGLIDLVPSVGDPFARVSRIVLCHRKGMRVSENCKHLLEMIPEYQADRNLDTGEYKIKNKTAFHAIDALGYGLMLVPLDSRDEPELDKPDYLRKSGMDNLTRRHHEAEWKRLKAYDDRALQGPEQPAIPKWDVAEFWGGDQVEIADSFGGR